MNDIYERLLLNIDLDFVNEHPELTLDIIEYLLEDRKIFEDNNDRN